MQTQSWKNWVSDELNYRTLSTEIEYLQGIQNIKKNSKGISEHCRYFQN